MNEIDLINCPSCQKEVSPKAISCPQCGHSFKKYRGHSFEWKTQKTVWGLPLVHITFGVNKATGRPHVSKGIIAIGQYALGIITVAQFGFGLLFGFGQFMVGYAVLSQFGFALYLAVGQFVAAKTTIGQFAYGKYVLAQVGAGEFVWSLARKDPEAIEHFKHILTALKNYLPFS